VDPHDHAPLLDRRGRSFPSKAARVGARVHQAHAVACGAWPATTKRLRAAEASAAQLRRTAAAQAAKIAALQTQLSEATAGAAAGAGDRPSPLADEANPPPPPQRPLVHSVPTTTMLDVDDAGDVRARIVVVLGQPLLGAWLTRPPSEN
jgi:hypothetical protein